MASARSSLRLQRARDGAGDLGHLDAVRQAGAEQIALVVDEDLRLVFKPAKSRRMHDPVAVALELAAIPWGAVRQKRDRGELPSSTA
jgi:hypothetical protein